MKFWEFVRNLFKKKVTSPPTVVISPKPPIPEIPQSSDDMTFIQINESIISTLKSTCLVILDNCDRYKSVSDSTGVPWDVIAAIHYRESSLDFYSCLHNGEKIIGNGKKTKLVPEGRGPFVSWEDAAIDALKMESSKFPKKWNTEGKLDFCEKYNGLGYRKKGLPSPYVYAGTYKYKSGLYVADGKYDSNKIDRRLGCAAIIKGLIVV